jgi:hypothetical protein
LSLNDLTIETDKKISSIHRLKFALSIFELKDDLETANPGESAERQISSPVDMDLVAVVRDPFSPRRQVEVAQVPQKPKKTKRTTQKPTEPKLVLMGIMDIDGNRRAIINNNVLKPGDMIRGQRIDEIADDHVIIGEGERSYSLYLNGSSPLEGLEVKR